MGQEPEVIEQNIAATREDLSRNVDELADKVSPSRVVGRQVDSAKGRLGSVKDKVMGSAHHGSGAVSGATSSAGDTLTGAAGQVTSRTEGSPLAAGLIAFGAGLLASALVPASRAEAEAAGQLVSAAKEHGQPLVDQAKSAGQEVGEHLKDQAVEAAQDLKDSAQGSAQHVAEDGRSAAETVKQEAPGT